MNTLLSLEDPVRSRPDVMTRSTGDGAVLVDMSTGLCWELNSVGAAVWGALEAPRTLAEVCRTLQPRYPVAPEVLQQDVLALGRSLVDAGLLHRAPDESAVNRP